MPTPASTTQQPNGLGTYVRGLSDRLPFVGRLPVDVRPVVMGVIDILLLGVAFLIIRRLVVIAVQNGAERVAQREEAHGNHGRAARLRTLSGLTASIVVYIVGFIILVSALSLVGVNVAGIIGTAGVAGLAFGFGAQKLVKDMITGFFILLEDQYAVGDYVTISGITGTVEELAMRTTRLRDDDGKLYILSNGDIAQVCNQSRGPVAGSLEIAVAASADPQTVTDTLNKALADASEEMHLAHPARVAGISQADATKTTFKVTFRSAGQERPGNAALHLRDVARRALLEAQIPLG